MKKEVKLSIEEKALLRKCSNQTLISLSAIAEGKDLPSLKKVVNYIIDLEKNIFFGEKEENYELLAVRHAFARGGVSKLASFLRIIVGSTHELVTRKKD